MMTSSNGNIFRVTGRIELSIYELLLGLAYIHCVIVSRGLHFVNGPCSLGIGVGQDNYRFHRVNERYSIPHK